MNTTECPDTTLLISLAILLTISSIMDIRERRIPNWITYSTMVFAILYHAGCQGMEGFIFSLKGFGIGLGAFIPFYFLGMMGAGDVKLMAAIGTILGFEGTLYALYYSAILGGIYGLIVLLLNRALLRALIHRLIRTGKMFISTGELIFIPPPHEEAKARLCYGLAISFGTINYIFLLYISRY